MIVNAKNMNSEHRFKRKFKPIKFNLNACLYAWLDLDT